MKRFGSLVRVGVCAVALGGAAYGGEDVLPVASTDDLKVKGATVSYLEPLDLLVFEVEVAGRAGGTTAEARGEMHGAPVLGYVFPTTLDPSDVGFGDAAGTVALAATSHPDFDDTPLWDEDADSRYDDDGIVFHSHWVLLVEDARVAGGLAVKELEPAAAATLPPTHPGMPLFLDSPGFSVIRRGAHLRILVPANRVRDNKRFRFDAVAAYMEVNERDGSRPMLGVYAVYSVLSGDLSLPFDVVRGEN